MTLLMIYGCTGGEVTVEGGVFCRIRAPRNFHCRIYDVSSGVGMAMIFYFSFGVQ